MKSANIDTNRRVCQISVKIKKHDNILCAMRLIDEHGENLVDLEWQKREDGEWITQDIPEGQEIIGLYMSKAGDPEWIQSLGFILWEPNPNAID